MACGLGGSLLEEEEGEEGDDKRGTERNGRGTRVRGVGRGRVVGGRRIVGGALVEEARED